MSGFLAGYVVLALGALCVLGFVLQKRHSSWGDRLVASVAAVLLVLGFIATFFGEQIGYY